MTERVTNPQAELAQGQRKHILGVNGHPPFLELLREILQSEHFNVTTTNYVPKTFDLISTLEPDLVIVDLVIQETVGWKLLDDLHQGAVTRGIPLLLTSTDPELLVRAQAETRRYGAHRVLACPFELLDLLQAIDGLIGKA